MSYTEAIVLGIVQGLAEFLPISSSGHLILVPRLFGWPDQGLAFDAVLHLGTLAALLAYFRYELIAMLKGTLSRRLALLLVVATIPGGILGVLFEKFIEARLRAPLIIAASTALFGVVMWLADRWARSPALSKHDPLEDVTWTQGIAVGVAQGLALIPGVSRSGVTITTGLLAGLDRATAARYSFLLGILITAGAGAKKSLELAREGLPTGELGPLLAALAAAFLSGWLAVWFLVNYLKRGSLTPFVLYRFALAALIVIVVLLG